jgi:hypothetical protein
MFSTKGNWLPQLILLASAILLRPGSAASALNSGSNADQITTNAPDGKAHNKLEQARKINLEYATNMPNFVADETAKRYTGDSKSSNWHYLDTIETEITFKGSSAVRERIRRNGKPWKESFQTLPGFKWYGGFGTELKPLFDPHCPTTIGYEGTAEVHGKQLQEYRFSSPQDGCFVSFYVNSRHYNPARSGHAFIDETSGNVIRLDEDASEFPADFGFIQRKEQVSWDYVKIGADSHLLPVGASFVVLYSSGARARVEVEYRNHRHFEASSNILFH